MATSQVSIVPVSGEVIPYSRGKALMSVGVGAAAAVAGAIMIFIGWYTIGGAAVFGGLVLGGYLGLPSLFGSKRLVIADDRIQEVKGQD